MIFSDWTSLLSRLRTSGSVSGVASTLKRSSCVVIFGLRLSLIFSVTDFSSTFGGAFSSFFGFSASSSVGRALYSATSGS